MRGTTRILIAFFIVFAVVAGGIALVVVDLTRSITERAAGARDPGAAIADVGNMIVWTVVPIVAITAAGLAIFFVIVRRTTSADRRLLATGVAGTARVIEVRDTGITINRTTAVLDVALEVTLPGEPPYDTRAEVMLGRMSWGALRPGMTVAIKADPGDKRRVAIDWHGGVRRRGRERAGARGPGFAGAPDRPGLVTTPGGSFAVPGVQGAMQTSALRSAEDIVAQGERAEGTIQAVSHTGATAAQMAPGADLGAEEADDPMIYVAMRVQPRQGAAFAAQGIFRVPKRKLSALAIGRKVPVAFLPGRPETATIDWSRV